ncbi:SusC/RagA family TonB-linked outer membrane protein [Sphingobacterium sp. WQ 366]|uniref:SusC/RagA family TonB-linked outer membrane protein n=1 Tax=Sphingobacterium bovistauri TaxID=2781959 RepID=A0ABS7Z7Z9_9SPHI|nr:SusC/RagA family TonB-linked outer membrane protein [Sphingobacterium bovistauri]
MKLTAFLYFTAFLQISFASNAQTITHNSKRESLEKILQIIKSQTQFEVLGTKSMLDNSVPISIDAKNMPLETYLRKAFEKQPVGFRIVDHTIVLTKKNTYKSLDANRMVLEQKQSRIILKIINEKKEPIAGATIASTTINLGNTNENGVFQVETAPADGIIIVKMLGYETLRHKLAEGKSEFTLKLEEEVNEVNEVIITGYQTINKNSFTGTAISKSGEELRQVNPQNVLQAIQVFDPSFKLLDNNLLGSNPNAMPNITIRGTSSLPTGNNEILRRDNITTNTNMPAFILDGYEVGVGKILDLDMTRIESVTLLKDAAATAVYGSRAANGVVVITTKAPKEGQLRISYSHETHVNTPDLRDYKLLNAAEKLEYERLAGLYSNENQNVSQIELDRLYHNKLKSVVGGINTDWISQPVRTALGQKHGIYLEGGAPTFRYGVDLRYQTRPGVMKESSRNQYSGGVNLSYHLKNKIRFQNELAVSMVNGHESPYGSFSSYARMNPYYRMTDDNGNIIQQVGGWNRYYSNGASVAENVLNPLYNATLSNFDQSKYSEIMNNLAIDYEIASGLRLRGQLSLLKRMNLYDTFLSPKSNEFYNYPTSQTDQKGSYSSGNNDEIYWDGNIRLNWMKSIGKNLINLVAGSNIRSDFSDYRMFTAHGFANDRFTSIGFSKGYLENAKPYSSLNESRLIGAFLSSNYSYDNKYLLDFTVRADGSSKFGSNNRVAPFWSTGIGWNTHNEEWFDSEVFSLLRFRATTGMTGAVQFSPYMSRTTYNYDQGNWYSSGIGAIVNNYGNENLGWQKTRSTDIGIDAGLWKDRLTLSARYYYKLTKDILADINIAPSTGFVSYKENLGDMENKGIELNFNVFAVKNSDWTVSFMANIVRNENKIVRISNALKSYNDRVDEAQGENDLMGVPLLRYNEGQSVDAIYAVPSLGIDPENGRELFRKQDGSLSYNWDARDIAVVAVATPKAEGFLGATIRYKQFSAVTYVQVRVGGKSYNQTLVDRVENADPRYNVDSRVLEEKWKQPGDLSFYKSIRDLGQTRVSSRFIMDDNLVNLQSLFLSYDAKQEFAQRFKLSNLRFNITTNDLLRWSSIQQERGISYPFARSLSFALQASF